MINKLYTSISWPISAHPPVAVESRAHAPAGALITEPKELEVEIDCDWVEADWRAGIRPDDSTMSTRELITPNVYQRPWITRCIQQSIEYWMIPGCFLGRQFAWVILQEEWCGCEVSGFRRWFRSLRPYPSLALNCRETLRSSEGTYWQLLSGWRCWTLICDWMNKWRSDGPNTRKRWLSIATGRYAAPLVASLT